MLTNLPVPYDHCVDDPTYRGLKPVYHIIINGKALVGAFNQEKALEWAFSVIVQL